MTKDEARAESFDKYNAMYFDGHFAREAFQTFAHNMFDAGVAYAEGQCEEQIAAAVKSERERIADKLEAIAVEYGKTLPDYIDELRGEL